MELVTSICIIFLLPLILLIPFIRGYFFAHSRTTQPPSPPKLPIFGNLFQVGSLPHRGFQKLSQKYGPFIRLRLGSKDVLLASSAETAREILKKNDLVFSGRPTTGIQYKLLYGGKDVAFAKYGEYWRQVKSICVLKLLSNKRVQSFRHIREEETTLMINKIKDASLSAINLTEAFETLTNDVICRATLGKKYGDGKSGKEFELSIKDLQNLVGIFDISYYSPWLGWLNGLIGINAKVERVAKRIDEFLEGVIDDRSHIALEEKDAAFIDIFLDIQRNNLTGFPIDKDCVKAVIMDMFTAGSDTTHAVIEWAMAELLKNPKTLEKLQNEVRNVVQGKQEVTEDDLPKMQYLKAVIKEALRLHSPSPFISRESTKKANIMGYEIAAGTMLLVNTWAIGRDPTLWKDPSEFQPERFMNNNINFKGLDFELIPFGTGRRGCPGIAFVAAVNELALAKLVHKFNFALPGGIKLEDLDMTEAHSVATHKKLPLLVIPTPCS